MKDLKRENRKGSKAEQDFSGEWWRSFVMDGEDASREGIGGKKSPAWQAPTGMHS
ncbi:hypothetical protein [Thiothrix winogradskyi]|uniref:Uncharacterized protein n=1 Tax=Thiothrix winogradskyi TaxID=96472 RepID=A0ABY3SWB9_9GAMM|nr:hypothetical protein [Thiothrix winogradskyi]UJS23728.1 hypothetical protein L2Y54_17570 [Thiothrix winogradskyi]